MGRYDFNEVISRENTCSVKYDLRKVLFDNQDVLPMWVADMDFPTPSFVKDALLERINMPVLGYFYFDRAFYDSIIQWMEKRHQWHVEKDWICFAPGVVPALNILVQTFSDKGDRVIIQPPVYHPFSFAVKNNFRELVENPLQLKGEQYEMDFTLLETQLKQGAKIMILSNPHNPVGRCWDQETLKCVGELCAKYHCLLISDEIHSDLILSPHKHLPTAKISNTIADNTITCMAPSKTFNIAGLACSEIIISNPELRKRFNQAIAEQLHLSSGNTFGAAALTAAYNHGAIWLDELREYLLRNVKFTTEYCQKHLPKIQFLRHEATYLLWADFSKYGLSDETLKHRLIHECKLGFNEGTMFGTGGNGHQRINIACPRATIEEMLRRLTRL